MQEGRVVQTLAGVLILCAVLLCQATAADAAQPIVIGDPPPVFTLPDLDGKSVTMPADARGRIVIIHFWADWCQYCLEEMPALERLYQQYRDRGLIIYAVNVGQSPAAAKAYVQRVKITYPVLVDSSSRTAKDYDVKGLPRTFFLDRKGLIKYKLLGEASEDTLRKLVLKML